MSDNQATFHFRFSTELTIYEFATILQLALCSAAAAITFGARMFEAKSLSKVLESITGLSILDIACGVSDTLLCSPTIRKADLKLPFLKLWNGLGAACDVVIAITLTCFVSRTMYRFFTAD